MSSHPSIKMALHLTWAGLEDEAIKTIHYNHLAWLAGWTSDGWRQTLEIFCVIFHPWF